MVTAVSGYLRNWNCSELNSCQYIDGDYLTEMSDCPRSNLMKWMTGPNERSHTKNDRVNNDSTSTLDSDGKQSKQMWRLRQILSAIQKSWHKQGQITTDNLKHFPLILFSPLLDRLQPRKDHVIDTGYFTDPNLASPRTSSEADLYASIADQNEPSQSMLSDQLRFIRLANPTRRHCNSESDLTWSAPNKLLPILGHALQTSGCTSSDNFNTETTGAISLAISEAQVTCAHEEKVELSLRTEVEAAVSEITDLVGDKLVEFSAGIEEPEENVSMIGQSCNELLTSPGLFSSFTDLGSHSLGTASLYTASRNEFENAPTKLEAPNDDRTQAKPDTPTTKSIVTSKIVKNVSFADEVGQALTEVYLIDNSDQLRAFDYEVGYDGSMWTGRSPLGSCLFSNRFARSRLKQRSTVFASDPELSIPQVSSMQITPSRKINESTRTLWVLCFPQPASQYYGFRQRIEHGSVSLENITLTQPDESAGTQLPQLSGTIKVKNISYEKQVWLRLTTDNWKSFTDFVALYSHQLSGGLLHSASRFDTFTFNLNVVPQMETEDNCDKIEFAVRYLVGPDGSWGQYWDNNGGNNYVIEKRVIQTAWPNQLHDGQTNLKSLSGNSTCTGALDHLETVQTATTCQLNPYTQDYRPNFEGISQFTSYRSWTHFAGETTYY